VTALYVNHGLAEKCGVYSFGVRHFDAIKSIEGGIHYVECNSMDEFSDAYYKYLPDVTFFNYMPAVLGWVTSAIKSFNTKTVAVQHLYDKSSLSHIMNTYTGTFDYMVVLDPSISVTDKRIYAMGRPLTYIDIPDRTPEEPYQIGTFGFALPHKDIHLIAREINRSFDHAVFNLHMTEAYFNGANGADVFTSRILEQCRQEITKPGITINHTSSYLSDEDVVRKLSENDINALFYNLPPQNVGRSSSLDYMIAAQRPILTTYCHSFIHAFGNISFFPETDMKGIIADYPANVEKAKRLFNYTKNDLAEETNNMLKEIL
jgi:hypothetical protein